MNDEQRRKAIQQARIDAVGQRLAQAFAAARVDIKDITHRHRRHTEASDGRAHFELLIVSDHFSGHATLARHRLIYDALDDLMKTDIHALSIKALTPDQAIEL